MTTIVATHNGQFHADDVFAYAILSLTHDDLKLHRTRDPKLWAEASIVFDVGNGPYDHHMSDALGKPYRDNGIPFSSAGLVWRDFGHAAIRSVLPDALDHEVDSIFYFIDTQIIIPVDMTDNGKDFANDFPQISLISVISSYNTDDDGADAAFVQASEVCSKFLTSRFRSSLNYIRSENVVLEAIAASPDERYFEVQKFVPYQGIIAKHGLPTLYMVFFAPENDMWRINCVNIPNEAYKMKRALPKAWSGLGDEALQAVTGVKDAIFCHPACFTCGARTREGIMKMLELALQNE